MILVDIYVPSVDKTFDFMLDEDVQTERIIDEVYEMLAKKMHMGKEGQRKKFMLCHVTAGKVLEKSRSLAQSGVTDGSRLMLI